MPAFGGNRSTSQASGTCADDGNTFWCIGFCVIQLRFGAGARVYQTACNLAFKGMIKTGLITRDASIDFIATSLARFDRPLRICQQWPCHRNHIGLTGCQNIFGNIGHIDSIGSYQGQTNMRFQFCGDTHKCRARYRRGNSRHSRFMPANAGINNRGASVFNRFCLRKNFIPGRTFINQFEHG